VLHERRVATADGLPAIRQQHAVPLFREATGPEDAAEVGGEGVPAVPELCPARLPRMAAGAAGRLQRQIVRRGDGGEGDLRGLRAYQHPHRAVRDGVVADGGGFDGLCDGALLPNPGTGGVHVRHVQRPYQAGGHEDDFDFETADVFHRALEAVRQAREQDQEADADPAALVRENDGWHREPLREPALRALHGVRVPRRPVALHLRFPVDGFGRAARGKKQ